MAALRPLTLITGASAGIGTALAHVFAAHGHQLVLVARRADALDRVASDIAATGRERPLVLALDVTAPATVDRIGAAVLAGGFELEYVVNNAGFGLVGAATQRDRHEQLAMIDLNVRTLTDLSLAFVDSLERRRGGILNVASVAAFLPGPGMAVYYATKAYVLSFSEALHRELAPRGVRVTTLCPGPVPTEFQARAGISNESYTPILTQPAGKVAQQGYQGLMAGRRVVVPGFANKLVTVLTRVLPRGLVLAATDRHNRSR